MATPLSIFSTSHTLVNLIHLTPNASKALDKLGPFLALVCYNLQCGSKLLVVVGKPFEQWHALDQLVFLSCLKCKQINDNVALQVTSVKPRVTVHFYAAHLFVCEVRFVFFLLWR